eukprot:CAMPEP_0114425018 /NCGR_PEP_ID=MMETSP0103-20121206/7010_1 /TAXON_ID=37642 ORGANISM="Paraphysomonas imperforata, Strain PA2" /NCGR_SAMPLE_ID=MMETSP0103 /ASSEMBLY_ACC=CAM_ASM_000201 /LENGTH=42 /DNA_ID= /DNA_START= /DNA_END= /DNA_ORIENTATION=
MIFNVILGFITSTWFALDVVIEVEVLVELEEGGGAQRPIQMA